MQNRVHVWEDVIDEEIREIYQNYSPRQGLGGRPALLCIDNYNQVFGDKRESVREGIKRFPSHCGFAAWDAIEPTKCMMSAARHLGIPVVHTTIDDISQSASSRVEATKRKLDGLDPDWGHAFFPDLQPEPGELVIRKVRASAFYGTPLTAHLTQMDVNTIIICGNSTSGCVRASTVDAYSAGYRTVVVEECVFDRNWLSHKVNLFDMNAKYADVVFLEEVLEYLQTLEVQPKRVVY